MTTKREILRNSCFQAIPDIAKITAEYFQGLNLHFFGCAYVYPNGEFSFLASKHEWPEEVLAEKKVPPMGFSIYSQIANKILFPTMDHGDILGWSDEVTRESKERFLIKNPMVITRKYQDHFKLFIFDLHEKNAYETYLNHFDIFENFIHFYKDKAKNIIQKTSRNPLKVDPAYLPSATKTQSKHSSINTSNFKPPEPKRYYLRHLNNDIVLSSKEYYCLSLLAHGKQIKYIAVKTGLSIRTIETYFERIKKKLNLSTRNELSRIYWENKILSG